MSASQAAGVLVRVDARQVCRGKRGVADAQLVEANLLLACESRTEEKLAAVGTELVGGVRVTTVGPFVDRGGKCADVGRGSSGVNRCLNLW